MCLNVSDVCTLSPLFLSIVFGGKLLCEPFLAIPSSSFALGLCTVHVTDCENHVVLERQFAAALRSTMSTVMSASHDCTHESMS